MKLDLKPRIDIANSFQLKYFGFPQHCSCRLLYSSYGGDWRRISEFGILCRGEQIRKTGGSVDLPFFFKTWKRVI
jgi:hypothetical protein